MMKHLLIAFLLMLPCGALYAKHDVPPSAEFKITGLVKQELTFRLADMGEYHHVPLGDMPVKNRRGEQKESATQMKGILLKEVLDSAGITAGKPKEYGAICVVLTATDGYTNVYSWNELFNTETGNHVYIITEMNGKPAMELDGRILVLSLADINTGSRHLKGLARIEVKKVE